MHVIHFPIDKYVFGIVRFGPNPVATFHLLLYSYASVVVGKIVESEVAGLKRRYISNSVGCLEIE